MSDIKLKSINYFRNNEEYFKNKFIESITYEFDITQKEYYTYNSEKIENIAFYKNYINDFKKTNDIRFRKENFKKFNREFENILLCINDLFQNITSIYISTYNIDDENLVFSLSQYFNNLYTIKQSNLSLRLNKSTSDFFELNALRVFIHETLIYLQFQMNKVLFIDIENTPLNFSFKKLLKSFKGEIKSDFEFKANKELKFKDFVCKIPSDKTNAFERDLVSQFNIEKGNKIAYLFKILEKENFIVVSDGQNADFFKSLKQIFTQDIGGYKNYMKFFQIDIFNEIAKNSNEKLNPLIKEVKALNVKLTPIIKKYSSDN